MSNHEQAWLETAYQEICNNYRAIDDLRMKLMGALPLASGIGIFLGSNFLKQFDGPTGFVLLPIGLFGLLVTVGLFLFEHRGMQRCAALIKAGTYIERRADTIGSFRSTPDPVDLIRLKSLNESDHYYSIVASARGTARVIYPTVLAAWVFVFCIKICSLLPGDAFVGVIVAGVIAISSCFLSFWWSTQLLKQFDEQTTALERKLRDELYTAAAPKAGGEDLSR